MTLPSKLNNLMICHPRITDFKCFIFLFTEERSLISIIFTSRSVFSISLNSSENRSSIISVDLSVLCIDEDRYKASYIIAYVQYFPICPHLQYTFYHYVFLTATIEKIIIYKWNQFIINISQSVLFVYKNC